jgi:hypothetical protein
LIESIGIGAEMARLHMKAKHLGSRLSDTMVLCSRLQSLRVEECPIIARSLAPDRALPARRMPSNVVVADQFRTHLVKRLITSAMSSRRSLRRTRSQPGLVSNRRELILRICLKSKLIIVFPRRQKTKF